MNLGKFDKHHHKNRSTVELHKNQQNMAMTKNDNVTKLP